MHTYILPSWTNVSMKLRLYLKFNFKPNLQQKNEKPCKRRQNDIWVSHSLCLWSSLSSKAIPGSRIFSIQHTLSVASAWSTCRLLHHESSGVFHSIFLLLHQSLFLKKGQPWFFWLDGGIDAPLPLVIFILVCIQLLCTLAVSPIKISTYWLTHVDWFTKGK